MTRGLNALYQTRDLGVAEAAFRSVLAQDSTHYGARFQLAMTLQREGKTREADSLWTRVIGAATAIGDSATLRIARAQLGASGTARDSALMRQGLADLQQGKTSAAAAAFQQVVNANPTHYGAHYQLAVALDRLGRHQEARPLWIQVLGMAVSYRDTATEATARRRLETGR